MNSKAIRKQLFAAVAMVLVAAVALGSSTYAWFVASGTVKAEGMKVQAQSESGILIKELGNDEMSFGTVATITEAAKKLYPASTNDLSIWYHANSGNADETKYKPGETNPTTYLAGDYKLCNAQNTDKSALADDLNNDNTNLKDYRLVKQFAIRSATSTAMSDSALAITKVEVTGGNKSQNFNKAIRVGVKVTAGGAANSAFYVYAPLNSGAFTLAAGYLGDTAGIVEKNAASSNKSDILTLNANTIPANDTGLVVSIFVWYEGEDPECKTANLLNSTGGITPDELSASVTFERVEKK